MKSCLLIVFAVLALGACAHPSTPRNTGVYLLVDTSGTYNRQVSKAEQIILFALSRLQPADCCDDRSRCGRRHFRRTVGWSRGRERSQR